MILSAHARAIALACVSAAALSACARQPLVPATVKVEWVPVWSDEFDGPAGSGVDGAKWHPDSADGCHAGNCGWGNQEKQFYSSAAENLALDGQGRLVIVGRVASAGLSCYYGPCRYTSAKITTRGKFNAQPGKVEARIKVPSGQGLWPAFWMLGADHPATPWPQCGEIDIMENKGSQSATVSSAIHGPGYSGNTPFAHATSLQGQRFSDDFHTFSVVWDTAQVRFYVDDVAHYGVTRGAVQRLGNWVFDQPFYVILNLAIGGHFDGDPASDDVLPATMLIDYVRVYRPVVSR
jgi:beta-glucanase (GH16 family)